LLNIAVSETYLEYVLEQLAPLGQIKSRRMFGGVGIYIGDLFFALIANNALYFKVDDSNRADYLEYSMKPFRPFKNKKASLQYYEVPADVLEDRDLVQKWAQKAIDVASRAAAKK